MNDLENAVARHYGAEGLLERILVGLEAAGVDRTRLQPDDLAPVDEFHVGGRAATVHAVEPMGLREDLHLLDIGCGIGGAARYAATRVGCRVRGVDLTPEYVAVARELTTLTGLDERVSFEVASALGLPFEDGTFEAALTFHVAMNIEDRAGMYREAARVMKPGGTFCVYDLMTRREGPLAFPVPWAEDPSTSHLRSAARTRELLAEAGFEVRAEEDRSEFAIDFFRARLATSAGGPPPLGIHLFLGANAREKLQNTLLNIERGLIAPVQMIATR